MKILLIGANGMLGHKLYQRLDREHDVTATIRGEFGPVSRYNIFVENKIVTGVDVIDHGGVRRLIDEQRPDIVINCAGIIKQVSDGKQVIPTLTVNSIFPHVLAQISNEVGFRLITMSTDCVFSGDRGMYREQDQPDAHDLYGMSKYLGEISGKNSLTIRTSIIGRELGTKHSLVEWFLSNRGGSVNGFTRAIYTGFPTTVFADIIADIIANYHDLRGVWHVSSDPISKYDLLTLINEAFEADVDIRPDESLSIDRSLDSTRFRSATGFQPPAWEDMVKKMAADW